MSLVAHQARAGRIREGVVTGQAAELAVERASGDELLRGRLANNIGNVEAAAGHVEEALRRYLQAEKLWRKQARISYRYTTILDNIGSNLITLGRTREALSYLERALAIQRLTLRPDHPEIARSLATLGEAKLTLGWYREASESLDAALAIRRQELGADHKLTAYTLLQLGQVQGYLGNHDRALELIGDATAIWERDRQDIGLATLYIVQAEAQQRAGRTDQAERTLYKVIEHNARAGSPQHANTGQALILLGDLDNRRRLHRRALDRCRRGIELIRRELGESTTAQVEAGECIGEALIALGDSNGAVKALEGAVTPARLDDLGPQWSAGIRFQLARALWSTPAARARARELARTTLSALAAAEGDSRELKASIAAWLEKPSAATRSRRSGRGRQPAP